MIPLNNKLFSYTVPKKEAREFRKGSAPQEWAGVEAALQYLNHGVLPPHWDRDSLFNDHEPRNISDCDVSLSSSRHSSQILLYSSKGARAGEGQQ